jgi:putative iron-regulated protein
MYTLLTDELAGERMYTGYESQSQEDEHSCFSDSTQTDIVENIRGVLQVWTGDVNGIPGAP